MPATLFIVAGSLLCGAGVLLGALAAHTLEGRLDAAALDWWQTAVLYQMFHGLGLLAVGVMARLEFAKRWVSICGWCFIFGVVLFCGALFALALGAPRGVAALAPVGGVTFVAGWLAMLMAALRGR